MNKFKFFSVLAVMTTALFLYSCDNDKDELFQEDEKVEDYVFDENDFVVFDEAEDWDKGAYFADGNQFFFNFHEGTQKIKQQMAFVKTDGQLTPIYVEMDENEFPYFILCGDTWIHVTDYDDHLMDVVVNKADTLKVFFNDIEHGLMSQAQSRGWRENNFMRNVVGVASMIVGGIEMGLGATATAGGIIAEAPTVGGSTLVVIGGLASILGGSNDFASGLNLIFNYDKNEFSQALADKLADVSYSELKKSLEEGLSVDDAMMSSFDNMLEKQDAYVEGEFNGKEDFKKLPFNKKVGLAKILLGVLDNMFGKTRTQYQMLCEYYCNLSVMTMDSHEVTDCSAYVSGYFYIPKVEGLENTEYVTGAVVFESGNPSNRWNVEKPVKTENGTNYYYFEGLKENTAYEYFVYFQDKTHMLHRFGTTGYFYTQENQERRILEDFYKDTNGDGWTNNTNWCSDKPLAEWYGITVNDKGRVTSINLAGNNLTSVETEEGYSNSPSLSNLVHLTALNLDNNAISGLYLQNCGNLDNVTFNNCFSGKGALNHDLFNVTIIGGKSLGGVAAWESGTSLVVKNITMTGGIDYHKGLETLTVEGCDFGEHSILYGNFGTVNIINTKAHSVEGTVTDCTITDSYFHHCGVEAVNLTFTNSTTYDTWFARTSKTMKLLNSNCATVCGGDFEESCSITVYNTRLYRPNWRDDDTATYSFSCRGSNWYDMFEDDDD